tara:strand:+ start:1698 stop:2162 length:465 start_codon:yes stop_codon:yes gene_type:complete
MTYFINIIRKLKILIIIFLMSFFNTSLFSEESAKDIIKKRKSLFSANYKTAKRVDILSKNLEYDKTKEFMKVVSKNYLDLLNLFPENTKEGHGTEALPSVWENKEEFDALMKKSSDDMIKLASVIEDSDDIRATLKQYMWKNCNACHSKFRKPH